MSSSNNHQQQQQQQPSSAPFRLDMSSIPASAAPGPISPQLEKDAARAMSSTESWKPTIERKQSYHKEDQKHELQMRMTSAGAPQAPPPQGFSERSG